MILAPSCLGKLPLHGDFLRIRVNQLQKTKLDTWFAMLGKTSNSKLKGVADTTLSPKIEAAYPWCFVMHGALLGASNKLLAIGVLFDSSDKVGRRYPFIIYQLVPKRWLVNQLKEPKHWLQSLYRFAKACHEKDSSEIDVALNQLWVIYKPQLLDYFKAHTHVQRRYMSQQAEQLLKRWQIPQPKFEDVGVINPPWADWPYNLNMKKLASVWWQLDDAGRYLNCIEHDTLDKSLIEQLFGEARGV